MDKFTPAHCRAARAWLGWSQAFLAARADIATSTVADYERGARQPVVASLDAMRRALERSGIEFLEHGVKWHAAKPWGWDGRTR